MSEIRYSELVVDAIRDKFARHYPRPVYIKILADRPLNHGHLYVLFVRLGYLEYRYRVAIDEKGVVHKIGRRVMVI